MNISDAAREAYRLLQRTPSMSMPEAIQRGIDTATAALTLELETVKGERDTYEAILITAKRIQAERDQLRQQLADQDALISKGAEAMGFIRFAALCLKLGGPEWNEEPGFTKALNTAFLKLTKERDDLAQQLAEAREGIARLNK